MKGKLLLIKYRTKVEDFSSFKKMAILNWVLLKKNTDLYLFFLFDIFLKFDFVAYHLNVFVSSMQICCLDEVHWWFCCQLIASQHLFNLALFLLGDIPRLLLLI
jgi:hypothetical protein